MASQEPKWMDDLRGRPITVISAGTLGRRIALRFAT